MTYPDPSILTTLEKQDLHLHELEQQVEQMRSIVEAALVWAAGGETLVEGRTQRTTLELAVDAYRVKRAEASSNSASNARIAERVSQLPNEQPPPGFVERALERWQALPVLSCPVCGCTEVPQAREVATLQAEHDALITALARLRTEHDELVEELAKRDADAWYAERQLEIETLAHAETRHERDALVTKLSTTLERGREIARDWLGRSSEAAPDQAPNFDLDPDDTTTLVTVAFEQCVVDLHAMTADRDALAAKLAQVDHLPPSPREEAASIATEMLTFFERGMGIRVEVLNGRWTDEMLALVARAVVAPPNCPTSLGDVWIGETRPDPAPLTAVRIAAWIDELDNSRRLHHSSEGLKVSTDLGTHSTSELLTSAIRAGHWKLP